MRRLLCMLLIFSFLCCMFGCHSQEDELKEPVNFYYYKNPISFYGKDDVVVAEVRESFGYDDLVRLIDLYLLGPESEDFTSPFPKHTTALEITQENEKIHITLSSQFATLKGINLTLSCACLSMTLLELTGANSVVITVAGELLDGSEQIVMTKDSLTLTDIYTQPYDATLQTED